VSERQQVLYLWANGSALDSGVIAWSFYDGANGDGDQPPDTEPPYATGVAALVDGWRLLQSAQLVAPPAGEEHRNAYLEYEFVFERMSASRQSS
jgi:hypothetical protein